MCAWLRQEGNEVNRKRIKRLMQEMGIEALYPKPRTSIPCPWSLRFPYLLRGLKIEKPNHVWSTDITYVRLSGGFVYLVAVIDWFSRYVLSWELSNTLDKDFCIRALESALRLGTPSIFNTDQGCQFTSDAFLRVLQSKNIRISMDGRGRALDNIFIERLWRSVKYEDIYLKDYGSMKEVRQGLENYFEFYNHTRIHQSLNYLTPAKIHQK
jgi:putative transposase